MVRDQSRCIRCRECEFQAQRARIVLARAAGDRTRALVEHSNAITPRNGGPAIGIKPKASSACSPTAGRNNRGDTPRFPVPARSDCRTGLLGALGQGLHITHWPSEYVSTGHRLVTWGARNSMRRGCQGARRRTIPDLFLRSVYLSNRESREKGGNVPEQNRGWRIRREG